MMKFTEDEARGIQLRSPIQPTFWNSMAGR